MDLGQNMDGGALGPDPQKVESVRVASVNGAPLFSPPAVTGFVGRVTVRAGQQTRQFIVSDEMHPAVSASLCARLQKIRLTFDLPTAWLAKILRVKRQTLYVWSEGTGSVSVTPRESNVQRINQLLALGEIWRQFSEIRFNRRHALLSFEHKPLLEWLEKLDLDDMKLRTMFEEAAKMDKPHHLLRSRSERSSAHPFAHRERLLRRGLVGEPEE